MSWQIRCIDNTVKITSKCARELFEVQKYPGSDEGPYFYSVDDVVSDGYLHFNRDHCEHQDYLSDDEILAVLKKHRVKGTVAWMDVEGFSEDPLGRYWKYVFDGKGGCKYYTGDAKVTWSEEESR